MKYMRKRSYNPNEISGRWNFLINIFLLLPFIACILPIWLVYSVAFSSENSVAKNGYQLIPKEFTLSAFEYYLKVGDQVWTSYRVTIVVTIVGTLTAILVISMLSYVLSRNDFRYRNILSFMVLFTMLFNGGLVSSYIINVTLFHLDDTIFILILPQLINAFYVIVLRTFYKTTIPDSIIESANIDGAGEFTIFFKIVFPLSKPGLATVGLFVLIGYWNDWFAGLLYIMNPKLVPIQTLLTRIQNSLEFIKQNSELANSAAGVDLAVNAPTESGRMALTVLVMTPILFAYPFFQKYFVKGLTIGSVKG